MLPATAHDVSIQGFPPCATSHNNSRSVLPGSGSGMTEESITETENSPSAPICVSQCGMGAGFALSAADLAACRKDVLMRNVFWYWDLRLQILNEPRFYCAGAP